MKKLFALIFLFASNLTLAMNGEGDWHQIMSSDDGEMFILPSSFAIDEFNQPTIWIKSEFNSPQDEVFAQDLLYVANCDTRKIGASHIVTYDQDYRVIDDIRLNSILAPMNTFRIGGFHHGIYKLLCNDE